eukprot:TRINITY_DN1952_c0_g1_i1.p2 TRINITY_DN1952_c0_g1~~TRINITY_DN1952_c0_g1_i1.p2  ORF type:complete len:214 (-),score=5.54 TRINITY_DN1952_c0_g1_i1:1111-1752(-)
MSHTYKIFLLFQGILMEPSPLLFFNTFPIYFLPKFLLTPPPQTSCTQLPQKAASTPSPTMIEYSEGSISPASFFPIEPLSERAKLDPVSAFQLEVLRSHIISQPPLCATTSRSDTYRDCGVVSGRETRPVIDYIKPIIKTVEGKKEATKANNVNSAKEKYTNLERQLKVKKFLEKSRKRRETRKVSRRYKGRQKAALAKPRENGKFKKVHQRS